MCQWEIGGGNALISLRSAVKQEEEEDARRLLCERAQDSWTVRWKNDINTVQFLAQTDRFVSLDLNVSSRAAGFNLVCFFFLSKPWVPLTAIIWLQRFELKIFVCVLLKKQSHLHLGKLFGYQHSSNVFLCVCVCVCVCVCLTEERKS